MKITNGRLATYVSDLTGTIVEKSISNPTAGVYSRDKTVLLPKNHKLKQLGIDYIELSTMPKHSETGLHKHIWVGKLIEGKDADGKVNTYRKVLIEGDKGQGFKAIREFIQIVKRHNIKIG